MKLNRRHAVMSAALVPFALRAGPTRAQTPVVATPDVAMASPELDAALQSFVDEIGVAGVAACISHDDGRTISSVAGTADFTTNAPISPDMHFRIGSITKTFTATAFLQQVDAGYVTLDQTLADVLPEYAWMPGADAITMDMLLSMRSGLPEYTSVLATKMRTDPTQYIAPAKLMEMMRDEPAQANPGKEWIYTNTNFQLLGEVVSTFTGSTIDVAINDIVAKAGLTQTLFPTDMAMPEPYAHGYLYPEGQAIMEREYARMMGTPVAATPVASPSVTGPLDVTSTMHPSIAGAAGAMISTPSDLAMWGRTILDGTLLSPESHARMVDLKAVDDQLSYGYGLMGIGPFIGHAGTIDGYQAVMMRNAEAGLTYAGMVNTYISRTGQDSWGPLLDLMASVVPTMP